MDKSRKIGLCTYSHKNKVRSNRFNIDNILCDIEGSLRAIATNGLYQEESCLIYIEKRIIEDHDAYRLVMNSLGEECLEIIYQPDDATDNIQDIYEVITSHFESVCSYLRLKYITNDFTFTVSDEEMDIF